MDKDIKKQIELLVSLKGKVEGIIKKIKEGQKELSLLTLIYDSGRDYDVYDKLSTAINKLEHIQKQRIDNSDFYLCKNLIKDFERLIQETKQILKGYKENPHSILFMTYLIKTCKELNKV